MSNNFVQDIAEMHSKFSVNQKVTDFDSDKLKQFLDFRIKFLDEELTELKESTSGDDTVDALIDLVVVAIGTLDSFGVDSVEAWNRVYQANMSKEVGIKPSRPNPLGLPDLVKPSGWLAPSHKDNIGLLSKLY